MPSLVITFLGPDQPGLVGRLSDVVKQHQGNWLESRMAHLAGQFAGIVRLEVADASASALAEALQQIENLRIVVEQDPAREEAHHAPTISLDVIGMDRPGIVREVTQVLSALNVNVEEFHTECHDAPMSGERLFKTHAKLRLPPDVSLQDLQEQLETAAADLMVDLTPPTLRVGNPAGLDRSREAR